jgi:hypothetical protein
MQVYQLERTQWIPQLPAGLFRFFADANNLERLTPPWLHFRILTPVTAVTQGIQIRYHIRWRSVPIDWLTEISVWTPPTCFIDEQRRGPYASWRHVHEFQPERGGTRMFDHVRYSMPWGPLGRCVHWVVVRRDLERIFDYRRHRIAELFGGE